MDKIKTELLETIQYLNKKEAEILSLETTLTDLERKKQLELEKIFVAKSFLTNTSLFLNNELKLKSEKQYYMLVTLESIAILILGISLQDFGLSSLMCFMYFLLIYRYKNDLYEI